MPSSDHPSANHCPVAGCGWEPRTAGSSVQRHVSIKHGRQMPCGDYVLEGNDHFRQDRVKAHLDDCPRCPRDARSSSGDDTDRSSAGTPNPSARAGSNAGFTQSATSIKKMTVHGIVIHNMVVSRTNIYTV